MEFKNYRPRSSNKSSISANKNRRSNRRVNYRSNYHKLAKLMAKQLVRQRRDSKSMTVHAERFLKISSNVPDDFFLYDTESTNVGYGGDCPNCGQCLSECICPEDDPYHDEAY
jgi:hypothetical protein